MHNKILITDQRLDQLEEARLARKLEGDEEIVTSEVMLEAFKIKARQEEKKPIYMYEL